MTDISSMPVSKIQYDSGHLLFVIVVKALSRSVWMTHERLSAHIPHGTAKPRGNPRHEGQDVHLNKKGFVKTLTSKLRKKNFFFAFLFSVGVIKPKGKRNHLWIMLLYFGRQIQRV